MLYILSGQDDFSISKMLEQVKEGLGDRESLEINTTTLEGQKVNLEQLSVACETVPFLTDKRLVIIEGLLARFNPRRGNDRRKKDSQDIGHGEISNCILNMPESTVLVLIDGDIANNNPLYKEIAPGAAVKKYPFLKDVKLREWVQKRVAEEGGEITPRAANMLARLVGSNLWTMSGEVNKLVLYASGRKIEEEDVQKLVGYTQQFSVFNLVDAILEFRAEAAEQLLQQQLEAGAAPVYLLTMLARQVRMIILAKDFVGKRLKTAEIQSKLGTPLEFVARKTIEQAGRYSLSRIKEVYRRILETDLSIKTGKLNDELALDILVAELSGRKESSASRQKTR